eukprot:2438223-Amphidinium_carterae.1
MPSWTGGAPAGGSEEFARALMDLSIAVRETRHANRFNRVDFAKGTTTSYLPAGQRHLPHVLTATLSLRAFAKFLLGPLDEGELDIWWQRLQDDMPAFDCLNPALAGPDVLDRKMLNRPALCFLQSADASTALHPGWTLVVEAIHRAPSFSKASRMLIVLVQRATEVEDVSSELHAASNLRVLPFLS